MIEDDGQSHQETSHDGDLEIREKCFRRLHIVELAGRQGQIMHDIFNEVISHTAADADCHQAFDQTAAQLRQMSDE